MNPTLTDLTRTAQDNVLGILEMSTSLALESAKAWRESTRQLIPDLSTMPGLASIPTTPTVPGLSKVTEAFSPLAAVELTYDFAEKLLAGQRSFVEELIAIWMPTKPS